VALFTLAMGVLGLAFFYMLESRGNLMAGETVAVRHALLSGFLTTLVVSLLTGGGTWWLRRAALGADQRRHDAVRALQRSEIGYRSLVENTPDMIFRLDENGRHLFASPAITRYFTITPQSFVGKTHRELGFPPAIFTLCETSTESVFETGNPLESEIEIETRQGRAIFNVRFFPEHAQEGRIVSVLGIVRDITSHRAVEQNYRMLFEQMVNGFSLHEIICDGQNNPVDYRFLAVNPAFEKMTGMKAAEIIGHTVKEVLPQIEPVWIKRFGHVALTGEVARFENYAGDLNRHFEVTAYRPAPRQFVCLATDVTERRTMELERRRVEEQLQNVQKLEGLGLLAGGIAHDFNNLLMAILGNVDLALEEIPRESPATSGLHHIKQISLRAADLCKQMLAYSGKGKFVVKNLDLSNLVRDMTSLLDVSISKKVVLRYNLAPTLPAIAVDPSQLRQVVMNLVINASEAIGERSGVISLTTGFMECDESYLRTTFVSEQGAPGTYVFLEVTDTGCGMDKNTQARIFDPFFTTKFTGRGLGLAAVLGIMRGHRSAIKVYSEPGKGTTFKMLFPASNESVVPEAPLPENARWTGSGLVLLVDDEEAIRSVAKRMLERIGFRVITASDGREAVEQFRHHAGELACVVMDLTMPHMDGDVASREMRLINTSIPVILSSGYNQQEITARFAGKGLAGFIQKPYQLIQITEAIRSVLGRPPN
jgi:two-component system cell cycle sensor histidine kinase/response regulator CckA